MKSRGTISLVFRDEIIATKSYQNPYYRRKYIEYWRLQYGKRFEKCVLQISPETDESAIREDGTNIRNPKGIKRKAFDPYLKMIA